MQRLILILFLLITLNKTVHSQAYIPFPDSAVSWTYVYFPYPPVPPGPWPPYTAYFKISIEGDTLMGGISYKKMFQRFYDYYCINGQPIFDIFFGGVRQDSLNKKVYFRKSGVEKLAYDFNLLQGSQYPWTEFFGGNGAPLYVWDIDSVFIGTQFHKRFLITYANGVGPGDYLVEGVGPLGCGAFQTFPFFEQGTALICFEHNGIVYSNTIPDCSIPSDTCLALATNEIAFSNEIAIFPNPGNGLITIELRKRIQNGVILIYNILGKIVLQKSISNHRDLQLDLRDFGKGIYLVKLSEDNKEFTQKVVVE